MADDVYEHYLIENFFELYTNLNNVEKILLTKYPSSVRHVFEDDHRIICCCGKEFEYVTLELIGAAQPIGVKMYGPIEGREKLKKELECILGTNLLRGGMKEDGR